MISILERGALSTKLPGRYEGTNCEVDRMSARRLAGFAGAIPTERKVQYLRALIEAGFRHLDAVSFVSPKAVPQMADSEAVLAQLAPPNDVEIIGIVVNEKGAERAIATGAVTTLGFPCSISETFLRRNQNQSLEENLATLTRIREQAEAQRSEDGRLHFDGIRKSVSGPLEQRAPGRSGARDRCARSRLDFSGGYGRRRGRRI